MPKAKFRHIVSSFEEFGKSQTFSGLLLIIASIAAIYMANSDHANDYLAINTSLSGFHLGHFGIQKTFQHWVNDGLMAVFFLLVGLEIKREVLYGELNTIRKASLPFFAAAGGMLFPALIFLFINRHHPEALSGWAIPTATDIAFALGVLSLVGRRAPRALMLILTAIAIVDDLGAVLIIAIFYNSNLHLYYLYAGLAIWALLFVCNIIGVRRLSPYLIIGVVLWYFILKSGIHATIAGVMLAMTIPGQSRKLNFSFSKAVSALMESWGRIKSNTSIGHEHRNSLIHTMQKIVHSHTPPLQRLEHSLHFPVNYIIIPIFVFFNAGVDLSSTELHQAIMNPLAMGVAVGLILGKVIGIFGVTAILAKLKLVRLPESIRLMHILPLSLIAGIGFTMSIFITELAYPGNDKMLMLAKVGILTASLVAGLVGLLLMFLFTSQTKDTTEPCES